MERRRIFDAPTNSELEMPREGIEAPTPAFSGQNGAFPFKCLTRWHVVIELYSDAVSAF
jgi:hypothetical protein